MIDQLHTAMTVLSLSLTPVAIILSLIVVALWYKSAKKALFEKNKKELHWFIIGVSVSFIGSVVDNSYWGLAWLAEFYQAPEAAALFHNGVYSNVPFRQICTLVAAACHIRAAMHIQSRSFKAAIFLTWLTVPLTVWLLTY